MKNPRVGFFDLETLSLFQQKAEYQTKACPQCGQHPVDAPSGIIVEGNETNLCSLGMSIGAVRDTKRKHTYVYLEEFAPGLVMHLHCFDLVVGYNIRRFDYVVLEKYGGTALKRLPTFDMFLEIQNTTNEMISLANIVKRTLKIEVNKLGANAVNEWWYGNKQQVIDYCKKDVKLTQGIFNYACREGLLKYWSWNDKKVKEIDTSHWPDRARLIVESQVPFVTCPVAHDGHIDENYIPSNYGGSEPSLRN